MAGNPAGFMLRQIELGKSATYALDAWRADGLTFTTASWYRTWGEVQGSIANLPNIARLPGNVPIGLEDHTPWSVNNPSGFAYQGKVIVERTHTLVDGTTITTSELEYGMTLSPVPLTPDQALEEIQSQVAEATATGSLAGSVKGSYLTGAFQQVGR